MGNLPGIGDIQLDAQDRELVERQVLELLVKELEGAVQLVSKYAYPTWQDFLLAMKEVGE